MISETTFLFQYPKLLWTLLLVPPLLLLWLRLARPASLAFSSIALLKPTLPRSHTARQLLFLRAATVALVLVALARPQVGKGWTERQSSGVDIVLVLDLSYSMLALDMAKGQSIPNQRLPEFTRFALVRQVVQSFIEQRPHDRIALIAFARDTYLVSPLTLNHDWLQNNLQRLRLGVIDGEATAMGDALASAVNRLRHTPAPSRIVILLSDGENNSGLLSPIAAAEAAAAFRTRVYTILAGQGGRVPRLYLDENFNYVRYATGEYFFDYATEQVDDRSLRDIAEITGGKFYRASNQEELRSIYREIDRIEKTDVQLREHLHLEERFHYPLLAALLIFLLERLLAATRYRRLP